MIRKFIAFYIRRDLKTWRALRRACRAVLPKVDQGAAFNA